MPVAGCSRGAFPARSPISRVVHSSRRVDREPGERARLAHLEAEEVLLDVVICLPESYGKERLRRRLLRAGAGFAADASGFPLGLRRGCDPAPAAPGAALGRLPEIPSRHRSPAGLPGALGPVCGSGEDVGRWQGVCPGACPRRRASKAVSDAFTRARLWWAGNSAAVEQTAAQPWGGWGGSCTRALSKARGSSQPGTDPAGRVVQRKPSWAMPEKGQGVGNGARGSSRARSVPAASCRPGPRRRYGWHHGEGMAGSPGLCSSP